MVDEDARLREDISPLLGIRSLYETLRRNGEPPRALMIGCASSLAEPWMAAADPGELMLCRNAGAIAPSFGAEDESIAATVEYAVIDTRVRDIVVTGHADCSLMRALLDPARVQGMPTVAAWLEHADAALEAVLRRQPDLDEKGKIRALAMVNVALQVNHLRSHPSVAAAIAEERLILHGWFFDTRARVLVLDDLSGQFLRPEDGDAQTP